MSDPRFFRRYLDILDEQEPTSATVNFDDNTSMSVDTAAKTISGKTKVGDNLTLQGTRDFSTAKGAGTLAADLQIDPNASLGVTHTQAGYKGQMTPTSQIRGSYNIPDAGKIDVEYNQGAMFQGAGKNVKPDANYQMTMRATNPQGQSITYGTNRNL